MAKAKEWNYGGEEAKRIPIGVFFETDKPTYEDAVLAGRSLRDGSVPSISRILQRSM